VLCNTYVKYIISYLFANFNGCVAIQMEREKIMTQEVNVQGFKEMTTVMRDFLIFMAQEEIKGNSECICLHNFPEKFNKDKSYIKLVVKSMLDANLISQGNNILFASLSGNGRSLA